MAQHGKLYVPTDADRLFVERSVMAGTQINEIADCLNITDDTLRKHFRYEITTARARLKGDAVRVLMDSLTDGSLDAAKYVLSRVAGWTEKQAVEHTGRDGGPIQTEDVTNDADAFTRRMAGLAARAGAAGASGKPDSGSEGGA
jgi:predicted transcriptional regulator